VYGKGDMLQRGCVGSFVGEAEIVYFHFIGHFSYYSS